LIFNPITIDNGPHGQSRHFSLKFFYNLTWIPGSGKPTPTFDANNPKCGTLTLLFSRMNSGVQTERREL